MGLMANLQVNGDLAGLVRGYLEEFNDTGCDLYRYLLAIPASGRMSFHQWWSVLEELQQRYPKRAVGIELGQRIRPESVGVLGHLLVTSENLTDAMHGLQRYQRLLHDGDRIVMTGADGLICMGWTTDYGVSTRLSDEVLVVGIISFIRYLVTDSTFSPQRIHFNFPAPQEKDALIAACGCEVLFSQTTTALCFAPMQMLLPVSQGNPSIRRLLEQQAQALLAVLPQEDLFTLSLREALLAAIRQGKPDATFVAAYLNISERTLFRRLKSADMGFSDVMTQVRVQLAKGYLIEGRLTQSEIALLLAYSEQSAFNRAFRKATGVPPGSWAKTQQS